MKKLLFLMSLAIMFSMTFIQAQEIINPISAETTLSAQFGSSLDNTINGAGLDAFPSLDATHGMTSPGNSFLATNEAGSIDFDLGGSYLVEGLSFWNENAPGPGQTGIQEVVVSSSEDGITYAPIAGSPTIFAQVVGSTSPAEMFAFTAVTASFIRFDVVSNYGDPGGLVAFAEVAFIGDPLLGITDNILANAISVYPNPASQVISIGNNSNIELEAVNIYDINGRLVKQLAEMNNSMDAQINISDLSSGVYLVHIYGNQASTITKFVKR